ncbi:MAG: OsmC family protein [Thermoanaerobaculia bacterium]
MEPVIVRSSGSFRNEVSAGKHRFVADEPASAGGTDTGPTPYDLLSAALGTCTSMTLNFLAKRENIPLEGVEVSVANDRMHAKDCADCLTTSGYIHRFDVKIRLKGNLTPEQRERLFSTAKRCPVYKTLTNEIRIEETLVE